MPHDLTRGPIRAGLVRFCLPLIAGNLLQQLYNVADTWAVGRFVGEHALAAVGSAFSLLVLLTSVILGLCMGSGVVLSQLWGQGDRPGTRRAAGAALLICALPCLLLTILSLALLEQILVWLHIPAPVAPGLRMYLQIVLPGMLATFVYNYIAALLRSTGNSMTPLVFLAFSTVMNIVLDLLLVAVFRLGIAGAAWATLASQLFSALGISLYAYVRFPFLMPRPCDLKPDLGLLRRIASVSALTSLQQSVMNFGILMVQSLVNSFGPAVMAAFAVGVKIDAFAYAPAQDFANGYATFISQNKGAGLHARIRRGIREALTLSCLFCALVSALVGLFARPLMQAFVGDSPQVIAIGVTYLRTEGLCYVGIGILFLMYATFRGLERPGVSLLLTVISLGLRVVLSYALAPRFGVHVIWWAIPIGWAVADLTGFALLKTSGKSMM